MELVLPKDLAASQAKAADIVARPDHYGKVVMGIREHLREKHSFKARLLEMIEIAREAV